FRSKSAIVNVSSVPFLCLSVHPSPTRKSRARRESESSGADLSRRKLKKTGGKNKDASSSSTSSSDDSDSTRDGGSGDRRRSCGKRKRSGSSGRWERRRRSSQSGNKGKQQHVSRSSASSSSPDRHQTPTHRSRYSQDKQKPVIPKRGLSSDSSESSVSGGRTVGVQNGAASHRVTVAVGVIPHARVKKATRTGIPKNKLTTDTDT
ncbi:hypothetical protein BaRGS_00040052, partial [Batillaria attramentaria]